MSNWEEKYEKYKNGELDKEISKLEEKRGNENDGNARRTITKEEENRYQKLIKVREKLPQIVPQIENILELKQDLEKELEELAKELELIVLEIKRNKQLKEASDKKVILEEELKGLQKDYNNHIKSINKIKAEIKTLKSGDLTDKTKNAIAKKEEKLILKQKETSKILENIDINNKSFIEQNEILKEGLGVKREYSDLSYDKMEARKIELFNDISKCDFAAELLLAGLDWSKIKPKLDNWKNRKFTEKGNKLSQTREETKKAEVSNEDKLQKQPEQKQPEQKQPEQKQPEQNQPEQKQPEQKQPEQKQPEQKQPEQKQPEQKQPEQKQLEQKQSEEYYKKLFAEQRKQKEEEFAKKHKILAKIKEIFSKGKNKIKEILGISKNLKELKEATQAEQEDINSKPIAEPEKDVELKALEPEQDVITAKVEDKKKNEFSKRVRVRNLNSDKLEIIAKNGLEGYQKELQERYKKIQKKARSGDEGIAK